MKKNYAQCTFRNLSEIWFFRTFLGHFLTISLFLSHFVAENCVFLEFSAQNVPRNPPDPSPGVPDPISKIFILVPKSPSKSPKTYLHPRNRSRPLCSGMFSEVWFLVKMSADNVISQIFDIFSPDFSLFSAQLTLFRPKKLNWFEKRLNSCEKKSKNCKIILSADVFTTKQNLAKYSTVQLNQFT